jgi:hypothetical protein
VLSVWLEQIYLAAWKHTGGEFMVKARYIFINLVAAVLFTSCNLTNNVSGTSQSPTPLTPWPSGASTDQVNSTMIVPQSQTPSPALTQVPPTDSTPIIPTLGGTAAIVDSPGLTQYSIDAIFDYFQHTVTVSENIRYVNQTNDELTDIILVVEPNLWAGGFILQSLTWGNGENIDLFKLAGDQLQIRLSTPLQPSEGEEIRVDYQLLIPPLQNATDSNKPMPYGYSARQTNLVDWYLYIHAYREGVGWLVHPPAAFGEHQVYDLANYQLSITLTEPVQDLLIAASAPAEQDGETYSYHLESARTFALSAGTEYILQTTTVRNVTVYSYSFPYDKYAGKEAMQNTVDALLLYSQLLMPYPHRSLSVVEADFLDGMEYDGLFFLSHGFYDLYDGTPKGYLTIIAAHETAHQWWYGIVGNDQALEPWLDEALSTYMEHIFFENVYPEYPPLSGASLVNWWWYYRVNFYQSSGWVDESIYEYGSYREYRDAVYLNGAKFMQDLRDLIGDQTFYNFLRDYAHQNAGGVATTTGFFELLKQYTTQDLSGLISEYFKYQK